MRRSTLVAAGLVLLAGAAALTYTYRDTLDLTDLPRGEQVENLRAFATLYGYVRYFHPSDAAASTDWDAFAIHGVRQVRNAANRAELRAELEALFKPIAPTIQLYRTGNELPTPADVLAPSDTARLNLVAWQHEGLGLHSSERYPYRSRRTNRASSADDDSTVASVGQHLDVARFRGKQVRLRMDIRTATGSEAYLFFMVRDDGQNQHRFELVSSTSWSPHSQTITVPPTARHLSVGAAIRDLGTAWLDDAELLVRDGPNDAWRRAKLRNAGFESGRRDQPPPGWEIEDYPGHRASLVTDKAAVGKHALKLQLPSRSKLRFFAERPRPGETVEKTIGHDLSAQVPVALHSRDGQTLRPDGAPPVANLRARLDTLDLSYSGTDFYSANVVVAWNVFQHFYPYFDVVDVNWDNVLTRSLQRALSDRSDDGFRRTLQRLVARLQDGHGRVSPSPVLNSEWPLVLEQAGGEVIVADTASPAGIESDICPEPGDIVVSVNEMPIEKMLRYAERHISGSPQYENWLALRTLAVYAGRDPSVFTMRRGGERVECTVRRYSNAPVEQARTDIRPAPFDTLRAHTYYVDLTRLPWARVRQKLKVLSRARNVIFDVRGYSRNGNLRIVQHLSRDTLQSIRLETPQVIYPDQKRLAGYDASSIAYPPKEPQIDGTVAFLTNAGAISYAEALIGVFEHYDLGVIVGGSTAGANGNINWTNLLGDYAVSWTGRRVRKHDGSQHHLVGIRPDIEAERTIEGVRNGQDEVLEKALEVLRSSGRASSSERGTTASS
ncbi:S41 family peptidase [Salinibacter ruber]|uniref:S41 family peptidase n=1 Tax=Salinibacter ruber TaxID=146919 RepID=UPI00216945DD|nr:C-terminal processing protease CtpA/Prc [Salinibacter ruber]